MKNNIIAILLLVCAGAVFAQEEGTADNPESSPADYSGIIHWVSGEASFIGIGARYEHMLNEKISVGANLYWTSFLIIFTEFGIDASVRYYPWGTGFFAGVALGLHTHTGMQDGKDMRINDGVAITPEAGWKIDVGQPGKFYMQPGVKIPITFGEKKDFIIVDNDKGEPGAGIGFVPYFGMGYAF